MDPLAAPPTKSPAAVHGSLEEWIDREGVSFSLHDSAGFDAAVDRFVAGLGDSVEVLGLGEPLHGGEEFLLLRNRLFQRLVAAHGYSAIAVESSFPRGRVTNDYAGGRGPVTFAEVRESGFSHGFGRLEANRELVEWMRDYNAHPAPRVRLQFYGFDSPTEMAGADSPRQVLTFVLEYLASFDAGRGQERRKRLEDLLGDDTAWSVPAATFDPTRSIGRSPAAMALRNETEDLISELRLRRPELVAAGGEHRYQEARQYASVARQLLTYHAVLAQTSGDRLAVLLGIRDAMMADNLAFIVARERGRGKVLAFAHNSHLQRGQAQWQMGPNLCRWWPAGAHLHELLGSRYAVLGAGLGCSEGHGIGQPEAGSLEARLVASPGPGRFIPTHRCEGLPAAEIAALPVRAGGRNASYFPLNAQSFTNFDGLAVLDSATHQRSEPRPG